MDANLKDLSSGFETSNNNNNFNDNKIKILENKLSIYQKENQSLKTKIRILQDSNDEKNIKIQEQLSHLTNLESENNSLKNLYEKSKKKFNDESNTFYSTKREQDKEINNMKILIEELKTENEKLSNSIMVKNRENNKLQQNLAKTISENKLYSQDNTILLSKVKEYEDNLFMQNNNDINNTNSTPNFNFNLESKNNSEFLVNANNMYENKLALYSSIINDEINLIAKYIDTYLNLNYINNSNINIPQLKNITNFPKDSKLSSFSNIINSVENTMKRIWNQNKIIQNNELAFKQEINKLNNILEKKNFENIELKKEISELKRKYFYLKNDFDKINNDLSSQKGFNKHIQNTMNDITSGNDDYIKGLYQTVKNELDKILNDPTFHLYLNIILEQKNYFNQESKTNYMNNGIKYLFEEILDKYILVNNCIVDDLKKKKSEKNEFSFEGGNLWNKGSNIRQYEMTIDDLNNKLLQKDKIISNNKDEKKLLINQINILQRDILNLRNKNISSPAKEENKELNFDYSNKIDFNMNHNYLSVPIFPHKKLIPIDNNFNNINKINQQPYIENNKYENENNNINNIQNYDNNVLNEQYGNINNNNLIENNNSNNEEIKDNQNEEEEEENELYYEGQQQFPHQEPPSDLIDKNFENNQNNFNMNNFENNNYQIEQYNNFNNNMEEQFENNENENYNEEGDYGGNQFNEIIEEEENENNTESNKNKSINQLSVKNSKINSNNNYNISNNNNMNNFENMNDVNYQNEPNNVNLNNNENNSEEEYINDAQINQEIINKNISQGPSKNSVDSAQKNNKN